MADRPNHDDRKRTPMGDRRERPVPCSNCAQPTLNLTVRGCDDCINHDPQYTRLYDPRDEVRYDSALEADPVTGDVP